MSLKNYLVTALTLAMLHFWTLSTRAAADPPDLTVHDLLTKSLPFPSGFQRSADCVVRLKSPREFMSRSLAVFTKLSLLGQIKEVHAISDFIYIAAQIGFKDPATEHVPDIFMDYPLIRGLSYRLQYLATENRRKLSEHSRELLLVAHQLTPLSALAFNYDRSTRAELTSFFETIVSLDLGLSAKRIDHHLRALVLGNLAVLQTTRLTEGRNPGERFEAAVTNLLSALAEDLQGDGFMETFESIIMVLHNTLAEFRAFESIKFQTLENIMIQSLKACIGFAETLAERASQTGDYRRISSFLRQLDGLLNQRAIIFLPRFKGEIENLRNQFRRPEDPTKVN